MKNFVGLFVTLALLLAVSLSQAGSPVVCYPSAATKENRCNALIQACAGMGIVMKWTGTGTRINRRQQGDGGCQCDGYCAFKSKPPCRADSQCYWNARTRKCYSKLTNRAGVPIRLCTASANSTYAPSSAPTIAGSISPTTSPTTAGSISPTTSPITAGSVSPTLSPTFTPSNQPTSAPSFAPSAGITSAPSVAPTTSAPSQAPSKSVPS